MAPTSYAKVLRTNTNSEQKVSANVAADEFPPPPSKGAPPKYTSNNTVVFPIGLSPPPTALSKKQRKKANAAKKVEELQNGIVKAKFKADNDEFQFVIEVEGNGVVVVQDHDDKNDAIKRDVNGSIKGDKNDANKINKNNAINGDKNDATNGDKNDPSKNDKNDATNGDKNDVTNGDKNVSTKSGKNDAIDGIWRKVGSNGKNDATIKVDKDDGIINDKAKNGIKDKVADKNDFVFKYDRPIDTPIADGIQNNGAMDKPNVDANKVDKAYESLKIDIPALSPSSDKPPKSDNGNGILVEADKKANNTSKTDNIENSSTDEDKDDKHVENGNGNVNNNDGENGYGNNDSGNFDASFAADDSGHPLYENSEAHEKLFENEENYDKFKSFLKMMELSGGMGIFCEVFESSVDHPLPDIDPQQPLSELSRLPREKLERAFRQLKRVMIQSYNARIFFPDPQHQYHHHDDSEHHQQCAPLSIMSAPSAPPPPSKRAPTIPTQTQIAKRLTKLAAAASKQQQQPKVNQQHSHTQQYPHPQLQQLQYYFDFDQQQQPPTAYQYYNQHPHHQQQHVQHSLPALPPIPQPSLPTTVPMTQSLQPIAAAAATGGGNNSYYVQAAYQPPFQPTTLQLATTTYTANDFAQFLNHRNMALLEEVRTNEGMLGNLINAA